MQVASDRLPEWDMILVLVNSIVYKGSGVAVASSSTHSSSSEIVIHEIGHTAFGWKMDMIIMLVLEVQRLDTMYIPVHNHLN